MYNNPYVYTPQQNIDRINAQITELENMRNKLQQPVQPTNLTQNFQLAPNNHGAMRYANSADEVNKEIVYFDTPFFSKDMTVLWVKNAKNEIKTYELNEIVPKDEKDVQIEFLQAQIEELKKGMKEYAKSNDNHVDEPIESEESASVSNGRTSAKKSK